ncbi:tetratricopeptide repeat protein [Shewanella sp. 3_MG-2023]|uniref:tetratricopeptide repeat protein n=1 Tax=Shewanella sp. 3_MG-2023 TaxID=3062635 RepID=UPI0026E460AB|nr:tetratricopeptide repeat protein [Shewanella sp. 3_MG-2023]MDO6775459.1 tetratricopeptide repeat protein [Shewanella sp. 3_MG-2023]
MSVINKVLKDLDKRQQTAVDENGAANTTEAFVTPKVQFHSQLQPESTSGSAMGANRGLFIALVMIITMLILGFMLYQQGKQLQNLQPLAEHNLQSKADTSNASAKVTIAQQETENNITEAEIKASDQLAGAELKESDLNKSKLNETDANQQSKLANVELVNVALAEQQDIVVSEPASLSAEAKAVTQHQTLVEPEAVKVADKTADVKVHFAQHRRSSSSATVANVNQKGHMAVKEVTLTNEQLATKKFDVAEVAEQQQKIDQAIKNYYEALVLQPSMHQARKQLAALYYSVNNLGRAEQILAQGVSLFPEEVELAILKAKVQIAAFSPNKALNTLSEIDDNSEWARDKWMLQSDIAQQEGQFALAEAAYRSLLSIEPSQARWWMGLAYALDSQQQYPQAADAYRKAMSYRGLSTGAMTYIEQRLIQLGGSQ